MEVPHNFDIEGFLALIKKQEKVLVFLSDSFGVTLEWMEDIVKRLNQNNNNNNENEIDNVYLTSVKKMLTILKELKDLAQGTGDILNHSLNKIEIEFRNLIQIPEPSVIKKLHDIVEILNSRDRIGNCETVYVDVRSSIAMEGLKGMDLSYLEMEICDSVSVESFDEHIVMWGHHVEFYLKEVLLREYELCMSVFGGLGSRVSLGCFARIVDRSGFVALLNFGYEVTKAKKDAVKLLKVLDVFAVLDKLRMDFNKLFCGKECEEIRQLTRDIIKHLVDGACEIFFELPLQVEVQGSKVSRPPLDGSVPRFMISIVSYCTMLLQDEYKGVLSQVLSIHQSWKQNTSHDGILRKEFQKIVKAIEISLETWSKTFEDSALSYFFLMNNYRYLHGFLQDTTFGVVMGDNWMRGYVQRMEEFAAAYLRESWGKLPAILGEEGRMSFFPDRATNEDLVKGTLKKFNDVFEDMYKRQSGWCLLDNGLREKAHQLVVQAVIPAYDQYLRNNAHLMGKGTNRGKYLKYSPSRLKAMLRFLFRPKMTKSARKISTKSFHITGSGQGASRQHRQVKEPKMSHPCSITRGLWIPCL